MNETSTTDPVADQSQAIVLRPLLHDWMVSNWPDPEKWLYAVAARDQMGWVRGKLAYMAWNSLLPATGKEHSLEDRKAMLTVDGTHTSKSVLLPVYRFDIGGVTTKIRGNFHDWCVRCWTPLKKDFPAWMSVDMDRGYFEGMRDEESPVSFCVDSQEKLFAVLWWMYCEGLSA